MADVSGVSGVSGAGTTKELPHASPSEEELIAGGKVMSIWDHLGELRSRIVKSAVAVVVLVGIAFGFADKLIGFLKAPLISALPPGVNALHFTGPLDVFLTDIKVAVLIGVTGAAPIWLYQFWKFFEPALYPRERRYVLPFLVASVVLFGSGVTFCYTLILPATLQFLIQMGMEVGTPIITIKDYVSLLLLMLLGFGLMFEIPALIVLLGLLDVVTVAALRAYRRYVIVGIVTIAAIVTPSPDPISQLTLAVPVYVMYEIAILLIAAVKRRQANAMPVKSP
jgi:sec-independent protein translocase protein TatC